MITRLTKVLILAAFFVTISSCDKQSCKKVTCGSGLECLTGKCVCADGTEGTGCTTASYQKYVRGGYSWHVSESACITPWGPSNNAFIEVNPANSQQILINNLFNGNCSPIVAVIFTNGNNEGNTLQIPTQNCPSGSISGTGSYDDATSNIYLQLDFVVNNAGEYQCSETLY